MKLETLANGNVLVDGVEYVPKLVVPAPAKGDPVFVWDNCADDTIPASIWYFHHIGKDGKVYVYSSWIYGRVMENPGFENCRPFDAALVGVPRKDWPKAKEV